MKKFIKSFGYAFSGLTCAFKTQLNFRIHTLALFIVCISGWYFKISLHEWLWITFAAGIVFISELLNTSLEALTDLVSPSFHEKAKIVKDIAAAAVLIAAVAAMVIGLIIFIPKIC